MTAGRSRKVVIREHTLILLTLPEETRLQYRDGIRGAFPQMRVDLVDHFSKVDLYIADVEVLVTFAPMLRDEVLRKATRLKWVQALGTGVDNLVDLPSLRSDVIITNVRGIHGAPLSESAICSMLLTPLTPATRHVVDARVFAAMKRTGHLVNIARGGVVEETDLIAALDNGVIAGAALDVFEQEPLPPDHALWSTKNVIITPHLGGFYDAYVKRAMPIIVHNMRCFLAGRTDEMIYVVAR